MLPLISEWDGALDGGASALTDAHNADWHPTGTPSPCPWDRCPLHAPDPLPGPFDRYGRPLVYVAGDDDDTACYSCALGQFAAGGWAESDGVLIDDPADPVRCRFCELPVAVLAEAFR